MSISTKPASGFRDFLPRQAERRKRVFSIIEEVYQSYGFEPLETPTMERLTTLLGKYGDEGDQLIFKVLQRGDKLTRALAKEDASELDLSEMGLRYDLTVPLARIVAEYRNDLPRYFKRYQLAPVWRADRPQKGRFREFYQCDVDVVGSKSMTVEAEVTSALAEVLRRLEFGNFQIHLNHRKLLSALLEHTGVPPEKHSDALVAIDKLDKIGKDGVIKELNEREISDEIIARLLPLFDAPNTKKADGSHDNQAALAHLEAQIGHLPDGRQALDELTQILAFSAGGPAAPHLMLDPYLARGLSYYTGAIFEIRSDEFSGSLGGGGRYDNLIGMFSKESLPACGFSLGIERIFVLMEEREMFHDEKSNIDVLVTLWNDEFTPHSMQLANELRAQGLRVDLYPDTDKYARQFKYADQRRIPLVAILAPGELEEGVVSVKDLVSGSQDRVKRDELSAWIQERISANPTK